MFKKLVIRKNWTLLIFLFSFLTLLCLLINMPIMAHGSSSESPASAEATGTTKTSVVVKSIMNDANSLSSATTTSIAKVPSGFAIKQAQEVRGNATSSQTTKTTNRYLSSKLPSTPSESEDSSYLTKLAPNAVFGFAAVAKANADDPKQLVNGASFGLISLPTWGFQVIGTVNDPDAKDFPLALRDAVGSLNEALYQYREYRWENVYARLHPTLGLNDMSKELASTLMIIQTQAQLLYDNFSITSKYLNELTLERGYWGKGSADPGNSDGSFEDAYANHRVPSLKPDGTPIFFGRLLQQSRTTGDKNPTVTGIGGQTEGIAWFGSQGVDLTSRYVELAYRINAVVELGSPSGFYNNNRLALTIAEVPTKNAFYSTAADALKDMQSKALVNPFLDRQVDQITIKKIWETSEGKIPDSIVVDLKRGTTIIDKITLSKENDWQATYQLPDDFSASNDYQFVEEPVPGFTGSSAPISRNGHNYVITITNSTTAVPPVTPPVPNVPNTPVTPNKLNRPAKPKLPQTNEYYGQDRLLIIAGFIILLVLTVTAYGSSRKRWGE